MVHHTPLLGGVIVAADPFIGDCRLLTPCRGSFDPCGRREPRRIDADVIDVPGKIVVAGFFDSTGIRWRPRSAARLPTRRSATF